jgi:hypothetical protein
MNASAVDEQGLMVERAPHLLLRMLHQLALLLLVVYDAHQQQPTCVQPIDLSSCKPSLCILETGLPSSDTAACLPIQYTFCACAADAAADAIGVSL